jgi:hypothetical protein
MTIVKNFHRLLYNPLLSFQAAQGTLSSGNSLIKNKFENNKRKAKKTKPPIEI